MGVILALSSALLLQIKPTTQNDDVAAYRGLAATAQRATGDALVVFDPNASETQMRATLQRVGARIVDGPTAAGAFVVRFEDDPTAAMLASLRSDPAIVRVESLSAQPSMTIARGRLHVATALLAALIALPLRADAGLEADSAAPTDPDSILLMIRMAPPHARPDVDYGDGYAGRSGKQARRRVAEDIARAHGLRLVSQWPMPTIGIECFVLQVPPDTQIAAVVESVSRDPRAVWAQPMQIFRGQSYNDPLFDQQPVALAWRLEALHAAATGRDVLIAQIDSGVEADHPDLVGQIRMTHNTVAQTGYRAETHGTAVAGILAARPGNGLGMVGVAPGARVLAVRACWEGASGVAVCDSLSLAKALQFAIDRGARVVNLSVGRATRPPACRIADRSACSRSHCRRGRRHQRE